jgi:hypothetical protein
VEVALKVLQSLLLVVINQEDLVVVEVVNLILQIDRLEEQETHHPLVQLKEKMEELVLVEQQVQTVVQEPEVAVVQMLKEALHQIVVYQEEQVVLEKLFQLLLLDQQPLVMVKQALQEESLPEVAAEEEVVVHQSPVQQVE